MSVGALTLERRRAEASPLRLYRRGRLRDFAAAPTRPRRFARLLLAEPEVRADRSWRARHAAARGRALPLRPRTRRDDRSDRGGARLVDPEAAPRRRAAFPAPRAFRPRSPARRRADASACGSRARAPAREGAEIVDATGAPDRRRHLGRLRPERRRADRHGLCRAARSPRPERRVGLVVRGKSCSARGRARCPSTRTPITAADSASLRYRRAR